MSTARVAAEGTVRGGELLDAARRRGKVRSCKDCKEPNPPLRTYSDPDYCRACVGGHTRRCVSCTALFTRDGVHTDCPCCRDQVALFGVRS